MELKQGLAPRTAAMVFLAAMIALAPAVDAEASIGKRRTRKTAAPAECGCPTEVTAAGLSWHTDYATAHRLASEQGKMLLVNFIATSNCHQQQSAERLIASNPQLQAKLKNMVLCRASGNATIQVNGQPQRLANSPAFADLTGGTGFVIIDLAHKGAPYYGYPVSVLPYAGGKYYRWQPEGLAVAVDLPAGTLTQRSMIWAVRMHPERPQSTYGHFNPGLAAGATQHSVYQASIGVQGHQNFGSRFSHLTSASGTMGVQEVVAESWPGQNMLDSCIDCVQSWRHSSGHWGAVSRFHRAYGYDIRRGGNGIWYGTGIFGN